MATYVLGGFRPHPHSVEFVAGRKSTVKLHGMDAAAALANFHCHLDMVVVYYSGNLADASVAVTATDTTVGLRQK
jgi:hypothetical protein